MSPPEGSSRSGAPGVARRRVSALAGALLYVAGVLAISVGHDPLAWWRERSRLPHPCASRRCGGWRQARSRLWPHRPCTLVQAIGRGLDLGAPFLSATPQPGSCQPVASIAEEALTAARCALQLIAWALAALFTAGFTLTRIGSSAISRSR
jgi:hypothetical protein